MFFASHPVIAAQIARPEIEGSTEVTEAFTETRSVMTGIPDAARENGRQK
jgi:hypothetical protein